MSEPEDPYQTSMSLLNLVRSGEKNAWYRLVAIYTPLIELWSRQHGMRGADIEDVTQNVFIAVEKHIQGFGTERAENSFRAWLWTITRSKIMDQLRFERRTAAAIVAQDLARFEAAGYSLDEERSASANDLKVLIAATLKIIRYDFSDQTWAAFWSTAALGQRPSEVAIELRMTPAAVCMCRARVLRRLRDTLRLEQ